jgi:YVTN family beta-propeller protein
MGDEFRSPLFVGISLLPYGRKPTLPAFTPDHKYLLVPNEETDNLCVVSLEELSVVLTIQLRKGSSPWQAKVVPSGRFAYVTNSNFNSSVKQTTTEKSTVTLLDLARGETLREIPVGVGPNGVTVDRQERQGYVVNMRSNDVTVLDVQNHEVIGTIPTGRAPAFAKLTLDGQLLVVTNLADSSLTIVNTETLNVVETLTVGIPELNNAFPEWGPGDTTGVAIDRDRVAYVTNYRSHTIVRLDLNDMSMETMASPIKFPFFVEIDRDRNRVVFSSGVEEQFAVLDTVNGKWLGVYPNDGSVFPNPDVLDLNLWMTDPKKHRVTALLPNGVAGISADWDRNMVTKFM